MKPELLLPAGSPEAFHAAVAGGADAVYLGLGRFNARQRAKNINTRQLAGILDIARERDLRIYVTLNTLIRNSELSELLDQLHLLEQSGVSAVIIQDWGVYHLVRTHFPRLEMHASTQMGIHNSVGARYLGELGFTRVVLARELTLQEIADTKKESGIEVEVFVHGALCYSFSGACLFSSWLGGMSANRGLCRQPCRRIYGSPEGQGYLFSLNDLQLLGRLPDLVRAGVDSLKIEGRMKNAEYVYTVARAYRMALDDPARADEAAALLESDLGRPKTGYFASGNVRNALEGSSFTGLYLGKIVRVTPEGFVLRSEGRLTRRSRIRIMKGGGRDSEMLKVEALRTADGDVESVGPGETVTIVTGPKSGEPGDAVYLSLLGEVRFPDKINAGRFDFTLTLPDKTKQAILSGLRTGIGGAQPERGVFVRIDGLNWLPKVYFQRLDVLILAFTGTEAEALDPARPFLQKNIHKIALQLPLFIPEGDLAGWRRRIDRLARGGISRFVVSSAGQQALLPDGAEVIGGEDLYRLNDAAAAGLSGQGIPTGILPLENDLENLGAGQDRSGIVPLFFHPPLFRSRMPLAGHPERIEDRDAGYRTLVRDGVTHVVPDRPACIFQHRERLEKMGYRRFLVDLSYLKPSQNTFNRIMGNFEKGLPEKQALLFNFKNGLQ